jgi:hypothetical protein
MGDAGWRSPIFHKGQRKLCGIGPGQSEGPGGGFWVWARAKALHLVQKTGFGSQNVLLPDHL